MNLTRRRVVTFRYISIKIIRSANGNVCWSNWEKLLSNRIKGTEQSEKLLSKQKKVLSDRKRVLSNQKRLLEQSEKAQSNRKS